MNVLLVAPFYKPYLSGSARLLADVVDHLHRHGHTVDVLTYAASEGSSEAKRYKDFDAAQPYRITRVPARDLHGISSIAMLKTLIEMSRANRYDVVFCGVAYPSAVLAYVNWIFTGTPYVVYSHGEDATCARGSLSTRLLLKAALSRSAVTMTNSRFTLREVESLGAPSERTVWCPPGIDPDPYENVDSDRVEELRKRFGLGGKRVILTLARLDLRKGHDMVVRALPKVAAAVPDVHYLIIGKGDPNRLRTIARERGVDDRMTIVSEIEADELAPAFRLADVTVMVSRWDHELNEVEGFGIVYLEAAACGRPSVSGDLGGAPDAVEHGVTGLVVDATSPPHIADALVTLLTDEKMAQEMGVAGRARVRQSFQKSAMLMRIEDALHSALAPVPARGVLPGPIEASPLR